MAERKRKKNGWQTLGGLGAVLVLFGGKLKFLLPLLKLGKFGGTVWSMIVMVGAYALIYPWSFAVGVVVMLFIHEMGHVWAAKRRGLPVSAPAFIPFLGALITMKKQPANAETEAYIAYGGPLLGSLGALLALGLAVITNYEILFIIAQVGFFLNLLNLLPIHPLDGGRIVTAISRWLWVVGLVGGLIVILYLRAFLFLLIWFFFAWELYKKYIRKEKETLRQVELFQLKADPAMFDQAGMMLPGENHRRQLPFVSYCRIEEQSHLCAIWYPGVGHLGDIPMEKGHVEKVELAGTTRDHGDLMLRLEVTYLPYPEYQAGAIREEEYYQVSSRTRMKYGFAYLGLAVLLGWLMMLTGRLVNSPMIVG